VEFCGSRSSVDAADVDPSTTSIGRRCSLLSDLWGAVLPGEVAIETFRALLGFWDRRARRLALGSLAESMSLSVTERRKKKNGGKRLGRGRALPHFREKKRERERRERERGGRRNSLPLFPSSTPLKSPLSPAMGIKVRLVPLLWSDDRLECVFASRRKSESEKKRKAHHHRSLFVVDDVGIEKTFQISSTSSGPLQAPRRRGPDLPPREQVRKLLWQADRGRRVDAHLPVLGKWICLTGIKKVIVFELVRSFSLFLSLFLSLNKPGRRRPHGRPAADRPVRGGHEVRGAGWRRR
jgi:hypothetical protein